MTNRQDPSGKDDRDEKARLAELRCYAVLDTAPESDFDDIVALASEVCGVPVALVSIVDADRQFFKAKVGLEVCGTARDISFCQFTIRGNDVLVVPDAQLDPRFAENPLVTGEMGIRFYAGMPLIARSGHALGTLCVIDRIPRVLDDQQLRMLRHLAHQAMTQLELRRSLAEREVALREAQTLREEARQTAERLEVISQELAHRVKNSLAIVQAIVGQTLRRADSLETARAAIDERLIALARGQDALLAGAGKEVSVRELVRSVLAPHAGRIDGYPGEPVRVTGPSILLGSQQALGLALGLHELATNAVKHGSLGSEGGLVAVDWQEQGMGFQLSWRETGGPAVLPPSRRGFGSLLLERIVPAYFEGEAQLDYHDHGFEFRLDGVPRKARPEFSESGVHA